MSASANGISFERPLAWTLWQPNRQDPMIGGPLVYLSTDPLMAACATAWQAAPNPPDPCDWPLKSLSPNGVFVAWLNGRILSSLPTSGELIMMNGEYTRLRNERPGGCAEIGAEETISVAVPIGQPTPLSNLSVLACLRGPDTATTEAQLRTMLASATIEP